MTKESHSKTTRSHLLVDEIYWPTEANQRKQAQAHLGEAGSYPFTRGIQKDMYRGRLWTMRQYAGFGSAKESNKRYHYLLSQGTMGLSVAFDLPTQLGYDPDHPKARGEIGKVGVSISTLEDMAVLFNRIDLSKVSTSMTINATAAILLAMYVVVSEKNKTKRTELRGTVQNDVLKEYVSRGNFIYPPQHAIRIITDMFDWCSKELPQWNPISISGYHIREAGSTAVQELAFTFANAMTYVDAALKKGLKIDHFAPRLSFFFNVHSDFFEEIAKFRAARRVWAKIIKNRYQAQDPKSQILRFHAQTAGSTLTAQQPYNNAIRVALQGLSAVLGGTQSLHTNAFDEALALPTEESALLALRTQQMIAFESQVTQTVDPLGGSYFVESLTDEIEKQTFALIDKIYTLGGVVGCIESGYIQSEILNSAYQDQKAIDQGRLKIVGVNCYQTQEKTKPPKILKISQKLEKEAIDRIKAFRKKRSQKNVSMALRALKEGAQSTDNLQEKIYEAVKAQLTLGEISDVLRGVFGEYREFSGF